MLLLHRASILMEWVSRGGSVVHMTDAFLKKGEIFKFPYAFYRAELGDEPTILDVGAANGRSALAAHRLWPKATVHSFEPGRKYLAELTRQAAGNPRWVIHPYALGDKNDTAEFFLLKHMESSSLKPPTENLGKDWVLDFGTPTVEQVEVRRLDDLLPDVKRVDILKIDVQGAEKEMLSGAVETLKKTRHAIIECGFGDVYEGSSTFSDITSLMESGGLVLSDIINRTVNSQGKLLQCDMVFKTLRA